MAEAKPTVVSVVRQAVEHNYAELEKTTWSDGSVMTRRRTREHVEDAWGPWEEKVLWL